MKFIYFVTRKVLNLLVRPFRIFHDDDKGNAGIEFALIVPLFAAIMVASFDIGLLLFSRFQLEATVSDGASYAMVHADMTDSRNGGDLAVKIAKIIASEDRSGTLGASITINNGAKADYFGGTIKVGGEPSQANACYCPAGTAPMLDWGSQQSCSSSCPKDGPAGKFVTIAAKTAYSPMFSGYGIVKDGFIYASAIVRTK